MHRSFLLATSTDRLPWRLCVAAMLVVLALGPMGCVRRRLTVRSWPPGAQVFIDDQEIGTTPCSTSFVYYGTRKVQVMKGGYKSETSYQSITPPWYQTPGLDFVTENLVTYEFRDERVIEVTMTPEEVVQPNVLLERAQGLRDSSRGGYVTPLPTTPVAPGTPVGPPPVGVPGSGLPGGQPLPYQPLPAPATSVLPYGPPTSYGLPGAVGPLTQPQPAPQYEQPSGPVLLPAIQP